MNFSNQKRKPRLSDLELISIDNFAQKISRLRRENCLTQDQLAEKTGFSRHIIGRFERGHKKPRFKDILVFAEVFGLNPDFFEQTYTDWDIFTTERLVQIRKLNEQNRKKLLKLIDSFLEKHSEG